MSRRVGAAKKSTASSLIRYITRYIIDEQKMTNGRASKNPLPRILITHNIKNKRTIAKIIEEFDRNESFRIRRTKTSTLLHHLVISFATKDSAVITEPMLRDIARKWIALRGTDSLYVGAVHYAEGKPIHIHLAQSGCKTNGRSSRISKAEYNRITQELEQYQQERYPELQFSHISHAKNQTRTKEEVLKAVIANRQTTKEAMLATLEEAYGRAASVDMFLSNLTAQGYTPYYRSGKLAGVMDSAQTKFRFSSLGYSAESFTILDHRAQLLNTFASLRSGTAMTKTHPVPDTIAEKETEKHSKNEHGVLRTPAELRGSTVKRTLDRDSTHANTKSTEGQIPSILRLDTSRSNLYSDVDRGP